MCIPKYESSGSRATLHFCRVALLNEVAPALRSAVTVIFATWSRAAFSSSLSYLAAFTIDQHNFASLANITRVLVAPFLIPSLYSLYIRLTITPQKYNTVLSQLLSVSANPRSTLGVLSVVSIDSCLFCYLPDAMPRAKGQKVHSHAYNRTAHQTCNICSGCSQAAVSAALPFLHRCRLRAVLSAVRLSLTFSVRPATSQ